MKTRLTTTEWRKVAKGAGLAALGATLVYLIEWTGTADLGPWGPTVAALLSVAANLVRKVATAGRPAAETWPDPTGPDWKG